MKKIRLHMIAFALVATGAFTSCSEDDSVAADPLKTVYVTTVTGAQTGTVNTDVPLTVSFTAENNCGAFNKVVETSSQNTRTIEVKAKYEGTNCGTTPAAKTFIYKFKAAATGTYILKFKKSATEFVTQTIVVSA